MFAMGRVSMGYDSKARRVSSRVVAWPSNLLKAETWAATSNPANSTMTFAGEIRSRSTLASDLDCLEFQYFDSEHPGIPLIKDFVWVSSKCKRFSCEPEKYLVSESPP